MRRRPRSRRPPRTAVAFAGTLMKNALAGLIQALAEATADALRPRPSPHPDALDVDLRDPRGPWAPVTDVPRSATVGYTVLESIPGGAWYSFTRPDGSRSAVLYCPRCGRPGSLGDHEISADGTVTPSVGCAYGCGFHESGVRLVGWEP